MIRCVDANSHFGARADFDAATPNQDRGPHSHGPSGHRHGSTGSHT